MGNIMTSCGECPSVQDWYQSPRSTESRRIRGYEIRQSVRQRHIKRSYADRILTERRQKFYELARASAIDFADTADLKERFYEQADKWERETKFVSSVTKRITHPSYQAILGMAAEHKQDVIYLLLRDLEQNRRAWFWALSYITQANPIKLEDAGHMDKMIMAWVNWGRENLP